MKRKNLVFFFLGFLIFLNTLVWLVVYDLSNNHFLEVIFFDVGQGEAIFIETPKRHQILIDGGPGSKILEKLGREMPFWDRNIDLLILTHPEYDHLVGLIEVLKRYRIENILWTGVKRDTFEWREWQKLTETQRKKGAKLFIARPDQSIKLQGPDSCNLEETTPCLLMKILYPLENLDGKIVKASNDTSIVAKLIYSKISFLFTGDIYKSGERKLIESNANIKSDVLKVAHHGSKTSSADEFIEMVLPKIAIISAGKENRYGHPHSEVLDVLAKYDITVLRTDQDGDIKIISDGNNLKIRNQNENLR